MNRIGLNFCVGLGEFAAVGYLCAFKGSSTTEVEYNIKPIHDFNCILIRIYLFRNFPDVGDSRTDEFINLPALAASCSVVLDCSILLHLLLNSSNSNSCGKGNKVETFHKQKEKESLKRP